MDQKIEKSVIDAVKRKAASIFIALNGKNQIYFLKESFSKRAAQLRPLDTIYSPQLGT